MQVSIKLNVFLVLILVLSSCRPSGEESPYLRLAGKVYGTYYSIVYQHPEERNLEEEIEALFSEFDLSLSTFNPKSIISRINVNDPTVRVDEYFKTMYRQAREVSERTNGAFDITVAPLVNAWGFGFGTQRRDSNPAVAELLHVTGYQKISLKSDRLIKNNPAIMLDASAIAKGQASDLIARFLEAHGSRNYLVEIGGEVMCKGVNPQGEHWRIGIDKPIDDPVNLNQELQLIVQLSGVGLATSGNYRQFYFRDGKKYAHTIDPRSGYPVDHQLLSATVIAPDCIKADAYATAFMVLGQDSALQLSAQLEDIECFLIYSNHEGELTVAYSNGFQKYITN